MRSVVVLAALASGCIATTDLGAGTTTKRRVLESRYLGDDLRVGSATVSDRDLVLPVEVGGTCEVKAEVRTAQVMRQKRVGLQWIYWIAGGGGLVLPFGSLAVLMPDPPGIFTVFAVTGMAFLGYGIYGAIRHNKIQNKELSARVDTSVGREACPAHSTLPPQIAIALPSGSHLVAPTSAGVVIVPVSKLALTDASAPWQIDAGALHAEWKRDAALRDQIAGAVGRYKPRLVVERLVLSPGHITAGDRVSVRASVRNIGGSTSVDGESVIVVGPFAAERASVPPLPPQGTRDVEITATVPVERDGKLDVSSYVHEGLDVSRVVLDVARKPRPSLALHCTLPDATSSWIGARRVSQVSLAKFRATCEVANLGDAEAANIEVAIASNGFDAAKQPIAKLAPLASTVVTLETKPANASGTIDLTFVASAADTKPVKHTRKVVIR